LSLDRAVPNQKLYERYISAYFDVMFTGDSGRLVLKSNEYMQKLFKLLIMISAKSNHQSIP